MRAALFRDFGGPQKLSIEDLPEPEAGADEVVIAVTAVGLNFFDTLLTRNQYQIKPSLPFSPGGEIAGIVETVGSGVTGLGPGDRVLAFLGSNGCREKIVTKAHNVVSIPDGVSDEAAASVTITYGTALHALKDRADLKPGETIAVLGASGGAGLAALEIAHLMGGRTIAVASSGDKLAVCRTHGADELVNYRDEDLKTKLRGLTNGAGVDVLYDCVGGAHAEPALRATAWEGRYLVLGFASGEIPKMPLNLVLLKGCSIIGVFFTAFIERHPERHRGNIEQLLQWCKEGKIVPHIFATFPLEATSEALSLIEGRKVTGKVIVRPQL
jgi:NADPH:quinone reductase